MTRLVQVSVDDIRYLAAQLEHMHPINGMKMYNLFDVARNLLQNISRINDIYVHCSMVLCERSSTPNTKVCLVNE
jgi:hypothetical protein